MFSEEQLRTFGNDGFLVVRSVVGESLLVELDDEVDALIASV